MKGQLEKRTTIMEHQMENVLEEIKTLQQSNDVQFKEVRNDINQLAEQLNGRFNEQTVTIIERMDRNDRAILQRMDDQDRWVLERMDDQDRWILERMEKQGQTILQRMDDQDRRILERMEKQGQTILQRMDDQNGRILDNMKDLHSKIENVYKVIIQQTRWLLAVAGFLAVLLPLTFKLVESYL